MALSTLFLIKQFAGISNSASDALLIRLVDQVSAAIERHCDRTFALTTYKTWLDGTGSDTLLLPQWPIAAVYAVSMSVKRAATLKFTGGEFASASVEEGTLRLFSVSTVGAETVTEITLASYPTMTLLAAKVATVSGWTMTIDSGESTRLTAMLRPGRSAYCVSPDSFDLDVADESNICNVVVDTNRGITLSSGSSGTRFISDDMPDRYTQRDGAYPYPYESNYMGYCFPIGRSNVFVWYKAGYMEPVDNGQHSDLATVGNVPADLTLVCNNMVKAVFDTTDQRVGAASSETSGDWNYSLQDGARAIVDKMLKEYALTLNAYRRMV